jgi:hypothetical protein
MEHDEALAALDLWWAQQPGSGAAQDTAPGD